MAGICRRLEGLPLAIELAAARLRVLSPEQIEARLGDRLGLLTRGGRARPAAAADAAGLVEWSYELCSEPSGCCGRGCRCSPAGSSWTRPRASAPMTGWPPKRCWSCWPRWPDKSMLIAEHGEGVARYRLPETLREFGQERLHESGEDTALRRRHRDWHEQLARRADTGWLSPQIADWTARLFREHANVRAAQDFCQAEPGEAEAGLRIALHVWLFYYWTRGMSARAGTGSARRWPGRASPPCGGRGAAAGQVSWLPQRRPRRRRCWSRAPAWPGSWTTRPRGLRRLGRWKCLHVRR